MKLEPNHLVVACHDAGGAEIVSSWARQQQFANNRISACLAGPAVEIFNRKLPRVPHINVVEALRCSDLFVCGTGSTGWEIAIWSAAYAQGVRTVAFIDHWKNYPERFRLHSGFSLPRSVWVADHYAHAIAKRELPGANVVLKGNPYIVDMMREVAGIAFQYSEKRKILVVYNKGEDILKIGSRWEMGTYYLRNRPHPADALSRRSLAEDIAWADIVIGWDSMALFAALASGREVFSVLSSEDQTIPYPIEHLYSQQVLP